MTTPIFTVPVFDPNRGWREWYITEVYTGSNSPGRFVPNINDSVWSWEQGKFRVIDVDSVSGISTLQRYIPAKEPNALSDVDILLGAGPGTVSESYRCFIDESIMPHSMALDSRLHIYGSENAYIKIFLGADISERGIVISSMYDQQGTLIGENIPLEVVAFEYNENTAIKAPMVGYTNRNLPDGELLTVVVYNALGGVVSIAAVLVKNTAFVRSTNSARKYITDISLECPFLSAADPRMLVVPINLPASSINVMGVVTYSNGDRVKLPVDGTKFSLHGLSKFASTIEGQRVPLALTYKLSAEEVTYMAGGGDSKHITVAYSATTSEPDGTYAVKLFVYPVWIDATNGYRLEYFMANLDRTKIYRVTPYVTFGSDSPVFNPKDYGTRQRISVGVTMSNVNGLFTSYRHIQTFEVSLLAPGSTQADNWAVSLEVDELPYGPGLKCASEFVNTNLYRYDLTCGAHSAEEWLNKLFYSTQPLYDATTEVRAPAPNFFNLIVGSTKTELAISQWNIRTAMSAHVREGECVYVEFFKRTSNADLYLGISALVVHQQN